jgi:release factor glutamine methyltransferase
MRIIDALKWGEQELKVAKVENPRWDADLLLGHVLNIRREQLYLQRNQELDLLQENQYRQELNRRVNREPLQYILQNQEFMGLDFYVDQRVLIPRPDSEIMVERLLEEKKVWRPKAEDLRAKVVDICTGSGALAISIAHFWPEAQVVGTDLSSDSIEVACFNATRLGVKVEWRQGDFLAPIRGETWDFIISNPPYIGREEYESLSLEIFQEPKIAFLGGDDGLDFYRELAEDARSLLEPNGKIILEIGWQQGTRVEELFRQQGFDTQVFQDYGGRDRVVFVR